MAGQGAPPPEVVVGKYPGFGDDLLAYLQHMCARADELHTMHITIPTTALKEATETVWMYQELQK